MTNAKANKLAVDSLSHPMGEGRGEGDSALCTLHSALKGEGQGEGSGHSEHAWTAGPNLHSAFPIDSPERKRLPPLLRRAWYSLNQCFRRRIAHTGVTPDQFTVMRTLLEGDPKGLTQRAITQLMTSDPNTVASLLERMEKAGLIQRKAHEKDRRAHRISLSAAGRRRYHQIRKLAITLQSEILSALPEAHREDFLENLTLVADRCRVLAERGETK